MYLTKKAIARRTFLKGLPALPWPFRFWIP
jgi:hypothetical protein